MRATAPAPGLDRQRPLGAAAVAASPLLLVQIAGAGFAPEGPTRAAALLGLGFLAGWACSVTALLRAGALGRGGRWVGALQLAAIAAAALLQLVDLAFAPLPPDDLPGHAMLDAAWPLGVTLMLLTGAAVIRAGVLRGWRRLSPLACGLAVPVLLAARAAGGEAVGQAAFGAFTCFAWALLGLAVALP